MRGICPAELNRVFQTARQMGAKLEWENLPGASFIKVQINDRPEGIWVKTSPYPGFPTDLQSPLMALMAAGNGNGEIRETVFEERFGTAEELRKLGARIEIQKDRARIHGMYPLRGETVQAADLRGGAALVVACLAAEGESLVSGYGHISRGYEDISRDLAAVGARISLV